MIIVPSSVRTATWYAALPRVPKSTKTVTPYSVWPIDLGALPDQPVQAEELADPGGW